MPASNSVTMACGSVKMRNRSSSRYGLPCVPVVGVLAQREVVALHVLDERERAGADGLPTPFCSNDTGSMIERFGSASTTNGFGWSNCTRRVYLSGVSRGANGLTRLAYVGLTFGSFSRLKFQTRSSLVSSRPVWN